jgi:hypothetical protein
MKSIQLKCLHYCCRGAPLRQIKLTSATTAEYWIRSVSQLHANTFQLAQKRFFGYPHNTRRYTPEQLAEYSARVEEWLQEAEAEPYGKHRGKQPILRRMREKAAARAAKIPGFLVRVRKIRAEEAEIKLEQLVCRRYALKFGVKYLREMRPKTLAKSLLGDHTQQLIRPDDAKIILMELWRYGSSQMLNMYLKENQHERKRERRKRLRARRKYYPIDKKLYVHLREKYQRELDKKVAERDKAMMAWKDQKSDF